MRLLILAAVVTLAYGHSACPALWTHFKGTCYRLFPDRLRREDAATTCGQFAPCSGTGLGELVSFPTLDLNTFARLYASTFTPVVPGQQPQEFNVWIGPRDTPTEGMWVNSDGSPVGVNANWAPQQPDNGRASGGQPENCAVMSSLTGKWSDVGCNTVNPYICSMRAEVEVPRWYPGMMPPRTPMQPPINPNNPNQPINPNNPNPGFPRQPGQGNPI